HGVSGDRLLIPAVRLNGVGQVMRALGRLLYRRHDPRSGVVLTQRPVLNRARRAVRAHGARAVVTAYVVVERRGDPEGDGVVPLTCPVRDINQLDPRTGDDLHDVDLATRRVVAQFVGPLAVEHWGEDLLERGVIAISPGPLGGRVQRDGALLQLV